MASTGNLSAPGLSSVNISRVVVDATTSTLLAVLQILIICISGFVVARLGYLHKEAQKILNVLNLNLFTPALIFSKIALSLDASKIRSLAAVPVAFVVLTIISTAVAWALGRMLKLPPPRRRFVMGCAMAVNSNSLPIALIHGLSASVPALKMNPADQPDEMFARGISYLVIYSTIGLIWRYSFMVGFLAEADKPDPSSRDVEEQLEAPQKKTIAKSILAVIWEITSPALVSAILSLLIASIKPLQTLVSKATPLTGAIDLLANISIPTTLIVLGAYFVKPKVSEGQQEIPKDPSENRTVIVAVVGRMVLSPIILLPILGFFILRVNLAILDDPIFNLAMSLLISGPTAITMVQLTSKSGAGPVYEQMISRVIFWSYLFLLTPITILSALVSILVSVMPDVDDN